MIRKLFGAAVLMLLLGTTTPRLWAGDMFHITLKAMMYETNSAGRIVATPITDQTLISAAAKASGADPASMSLVYNIDGSSFGDTIDLVSNRTGARLMTYFGLFFGSDTNLGRADLVNSTATEIKSVDYVYTLEKTVFSSVNTHSIGAATVTKKITQNKSGVTRTSILGQNMQWMALPQDGRGTRIFTGRFQTKQPFVPSNP